MLIFDSYALTRMHSSRMCTTCSSSRQGGLPQCMLGYTHWVWAWRPPGLGLKTPQVWACRPLLWAWRPPGVGLQSPPPPNVWAWRAPRHGPVEPPGVGLETPQARPLNFPPGCGPENLQGMLGYHPLRPAARHAGIPPAIDFVDTPCVWYMAVETFHFMSCRHCSIRATRDKET